MRGPLDIDRGELGVGAGSTGAADIVDAFMAGYAVSITHNARAGNPLIQVFGAGSTPVGAVTALQAGQDWTALAENCSLGLMI